MTVFAQHTGAPRVRTQLSFACLAAGHALLADEGPLLVSLVGARPSSPPGPDPPAVLLAVSSIAPVVLLCVVYRWFERARTSSQETRTLGEARRRRRPYSSRFILPVIVV
uniref:Uncharacterized protein n=1 Tax=Plectus sambesii TaxID=2011161 RepID=A0A914UH67_9BILA